MTSAMNTILIIGGTSGIGEAFARRFHSLGKKLILTGRRQTNLHSLETSLPGTSSYAFDNTDLPSLPSHISKIFQNHPDIDTVWINSGSGSMWSYKDLSSTTDASVIDEITLNVTAPSLLARYIIPKLLARSSPTTFMITGSGMGFVPNGYFPVYAATKAFTHHFMVGLRQSLKETNVNVLEIVPPMVETEMHVDYGHLLKGVEAMKLKDFVDETFAQLEGGKVEEMREVAAGSAKGRVDAWRGSIGAILEKGMGG